MNYKNQLYVCKTLRMMNHLCKKYDCLKISNDKDNPKFKVFLFKDSKELREYLKEYNNKLGE
jgi:hypothetical protein